MRQLSSGRSSVNVWIAFADLFAGLALLFLGSWISAGAREAELRERAKVSDELIRATNLAAEVAADFRKKFEQRKPADVSVEYRETELIIPEGALFGSFGYDDFLREPQKLRTMTAIGTALLGALEEAGERGTSLRLVIEGHTDNVPVSRRAATSALPTNWELSTRRATGVLRFLETLGLDSAMYSVVATGLADTRPIADNTTAVGRARNRRIAIRLEPDLNRLMNAKPRR